MQLNPHIMFNGQCREAFQFYAKTFGGSIVMEMTYGASPAAQQFGPEMRDRVIHARVDIGGPALTGSDAPPQHFTPPAGIQLLVSLDDPDDAESIFKALAKDGKIDMPFGHAFWAYRFGMCTDRFGVSWMINCERKP